MSLLDDDLDINVKSIILTAINKFIKADLEFHKMYYGIYGIKLSQSMMMYSNKKWMHIFKNPHKYYLYTWPNLTGYEIHIDLLSNQLKNEEWGFQLWNDRYGNCVTIKKILDLYEST